MNQSRISSAIEAAVNIAIGYSISLVANIIILPLFGIHIPASDAALIALVFTVISLARSYIIRRWFNARLHAAAERLAAGRG